MLREMFIGLAFITYAATTHARVILPLEIVLGPQAKAQWSAAAPDQRKRFGQAISIANKYANARFSLADYPDHPDSWGDWEQDLGRLMAVGVEEWAKVWEREGWDIEVPMASAPGYGALLSCSSLEITGLVAVPSATRVRYRTTLIGTATTAGQPRVMDIQRRGEAYSLEVDVSEGGRVTTVRTSERVIPRAYSVKVRYEQREVDRWNSRPNISSSKKREIQEAEALLRSIRGAANICVGGGGAP